MQQVLECGRGMAYFAGVTMQSSVTVFAPATVANLAAGFDCLGLAIHGPGDELSLQLVDVPGLRIVEITGDEGKLPREAAKNTAGIAAQHVFSRTGHDGLGVEMAIHKKMPFGSGLGSSAASAVAGAFAANALLGHPLSREELLDSALEGEAYASGARHADNVAPCLFGGISLARCADTPLSLPVPSGLHIAVVHPAIELLTKDARKAVPKTLPTSTATAQMSDVGSFVHACHTGDLALLGSTLTDRVAEPGRKVLIPCFDEAKTAALAVGALGCSISGAGPSIFALAADHPTAAAAANAISACFDAQSIENTAHISAINNEGATVIGSS